MSGTLLINHFTTQLSSAGAPIAETEIISWANRRLGEGGKDVSIKSFQDKVEI
jgi:hypothetical protein